MAEFKTAIENDQKLQEKVQQDFETGMRGGINGTPTFFVNDFRYDGDWSEAPFWNIWNLWLLRKQNNG